MIDWEKPIRNALTKRPMFVTSRSATGLVTVDFFKDRPYAGGRYNLDGTPIEAMKTWPTVENDPDQDFFLPTEHVERTQAVSKGLLESRAQKFADDAARENDANPLWGMF